MQQEEERDLSRAAGKIRVPHVLTVAGSDSGAGADLKACAAGGVYCSTVITAVTAQNTLGVQAVNIVPNDFVGEQLKSVLSDMRPDVTAKRYVETALDSSRDILIGEGRQGPLDHLMKLKNNAVNLCTRRPFDPRDLLLYAVTDSRINKKWGRSISDAVTAAIEGGATIVQLREKDADTRDFLEAAKTCLEICRCHGVFLLINDRIDIALACDADGVHVGQSDMPAHVARTILGPDKIIGVSCKTPEQAEKAWIDGADYIGCGGVYTTNTKENNSTVGLDGLKTVCMESKLPVVAIGGIGISNVRQVMELGVPNLEGVALVSAIFDRESVLTETQALRKVIMDSKRAVKYMI